MHLCECAKYGEGRTRDGENEERNRREDLVNCGRRLEREDRAVGQRGDGDEGEDDAHGVEG